jgi:glycosyltransferase involved in cell wall biosynthesis
MTRFSLVVPTIHRTAEIERLLMSFQNQSEDFEVIIVDQNPDDRVARIAERFTGTLNIIRIQSSPGASRARNAGLELASGEIVAFPDDDAWYPPGLLSSIHELFTAFPEFSGFCVRGTDQDGRDAGARWLRRAAVINRLNLWRASIEFSMFLRRDAVSGLRFNEELGPGAGTEWGSGEGADFLLRMLARGYKLRYEPRLFVHHPSHLCNAVPEKALSYARGLGGVLRLNGYPPVLATALCLGPLAWAAVKTARLDLGEARLCYQVAFSRLAGYRARR